MQSCNDTVADDDVECCVDVIQSASATVVAGLLHVISW